MKAILRRVRISSKKANLIAQLVRKKKVQEAIDILRFTPKKGAKILKKVIESAAANAENNNQQKKENLVIKEIIVTEGVTHKRSISISKGRMHPILKRTSHITVKVEAEGKTETAKTKKTPAVKENEAKTEAKPEPKKDTIKTDKK